LLIPATLPATEDPAAIPDITVEGHRLRDSTVFPAELQRAPITVADGAELLRSAPGAAVNRNGPLTGIAQYRGMYGDRVTVSVDGMHVCTGGPNGMDPPLSYIPRSQLQEFTVLRGIAPVSAGIETLGGAVLTSGKSSAYTREAGWQGAAEVNLGGSSADSATSLDVGLSMASRTQRMHGTYSREDGDHMEYPGGQVLPTRYERDNYAAGYGFRSGDHEFSLDLRSGRTGPTGTPALPMDIIYIDNDMAKLEYLGQAGSTQLHGQLSWNRVDHGMSNHALRLPPMPTMTRLNTTSSDGLGYRFDAGFAAGAGLLSVGLDGQLDSHDATITDPVNNPAFLVEGFSDIERDLHGIFVEWKGPLAARSDAEFGLRVNRASSDSGEVFHFMAGMNPAIGTLQDRFNTADRYRQDTNLDLVAKLAHSLGSELSVTLEAGRKTRAPSYQERYLWIPLQATNGLSDGHNYVGDVDLEPETALEMGLGLAWRNALAYLEPQLFYRKVDDYIQGVPSSDPVVIAVSTAGGDPAPLQFANVEAVLYGADAAWGARLGDAISIDGVFSYVRGKRDDIADNLYRIAPLNGRITLSYRADTWWMAAEGIAYDGQDEISVTNDELATGGYGLLNLRAGLSLGQYTSFSAGVQNLLDRDYADHLSGINRVAESDVPLGARLPGIGRSYYLAMHWRYH